MAAKGTPKTGAKIGAKSGANDVAESALRFGGNGEGRSEDPPLVTGGGRFTDDIRVAGECHAAFVRASVGHGIIRKIDTATAARMPGVLAVLTGRDLIADGILGIPPLASANGRDGKPMVAAKMPPLASERVRYVGEPIVIVVAESMHQAQDAAEAVEVEIDALPAFSDVERAMAKSAQAIHAEAPGNIALDWEDGNAAAVDAAFASAGHVERVRLVDTRVAPSAMEPRAAFARFDPATGRYTLQAATQGVAVVRKLLTDTFGVGPEKIRILTGGDVGGGFGMKVQTYAEYAALMAAARRVGRPVRWCATRLESFLTDTHGRDGVLEGELALDPQGKILALRVRTYVGIGAYTSTFAAIFSTANTKNCLSSVYRIPAIHIGVKAVFTNAVPLGPYRGAGRPEAIYLIERLIDQAARTIKVDRAELRRRNFISAAAMPFQTPNGPVYDSGEFERVLDSALATADWKGFSKRRAAAQKAGKLRGIGIGCFLEVAGGILEEPVDLRFEADGKVALRSGAQAMGQGHLSTFVPLVAAKLGIKTSDVRLIQGDSDEVPGITPSVASRSMMMGGSATFQACEQAVEKGKRAASYFLEADAADIEFARGTFRVAGTDRSIGILDLAAKLRGTKELPDDVTPLDTQAKFTSPQMSFPNGCHVCEVEIDPDTGEVAVVGYTAVDDVGHIMHDTIVEGQIHGGVAQGLGQVVGERVVYSEEGQLVTASFMDYPMPRAATVPAMKVDHHSVPCTNNPLGVKGAGESGVAGSIPSGVNAIFDALSVRGVTHLDLPMTAERVWLALRDAEKRA